MRHLAIIALLLAIPTMTFAADDAATTAATTAETHPHPRVPDHPAWAGTMVAVIGLIFLAAFFIGPVVRITMPQEVEPPHAHEEHGSGAHDDPHGHAAHH